MHTLYTAADLPRLARKRKTRLCAAAAWAALTVGAVAVLLALTNAYNERTMRYAAEFIAAVPGCAVVLLLMSAFSLRRERAHVRVMLDGPVFEKTGVISAPGRQAHIPGGIPFLPLTLETDSGTESLRVSLSGAHCLPAAGTRVRIGTVHGFLTAWEEEQ